MDRTAPEIALGTPTLVLRTPPGRRPFIPSCLSPLSPRPPSARAIGHWGLDSAETRNGGGWQYMLPSPPDSPPRFLAPKRAFKPVPFARTREEGRNARRNLFLKKVKSGRDDGLFRARIGGEEEMMRMIFVAEQKRWEASQASAASKIPTIYEEDEAEGEDPNDGLQGLVEEFELHEHLKANEPPHEADDIDAIIDREGRELEALLSQMDLDLDLDHPMSP